MSTAQDLRCGIMMWELDMKQLVGMGPAPVVELLLCAESDSKAH